MPGQKANHQIRRAGNDLPKSPIAYLDMSVFAHATEDVSKVTKAAQNVIPAENSGKVVFESSRLKGDRGNPIVYLKTRIEEGQIAESVIEHVSLRLRVVDKEKLLRDLDLHMEKGSLYIRLDKQTAFKGDLRLGAEDPIHLRIRFRKRNKEEIIKICQDRGLLPTL